MAPDTPPIADLLARFLAQQTDARTAGISELPVHDVQPYEAAAFPMVEPRVAWDEALLALQLLDPEQGRVKVKPPTEWSSLVTSPLTLLAVPMAAGNFPQLVRDLPALLKPARRSELLPKPQAAMPADGLENWAIQSIRKRLFPDALAALGALRLTRNLDRATALLDELRPHIPARWQTAFANEEAAIAWQKGDAEGARSKWASLPDNAVTCFNRGVAAVFGDDNQTARTELTKAIALLPEDNAWHHLARLYLALAQMT